MTCIPIRLTLSIGNVGHSEFHSSDLRVSRHSMNIMTSWNALLSSDAEGRISFLFSTQGYSWKEYTKHICTVLCLKAWRMPWSTIMILEYFIRYIRGRFGRYLSREKNRSHRFVQNIITNSAEQTIWEYEQKRCDWKWQCARRFKKVAISIIQRIQNSPGAILYTLSKSIEKSGEPNESKENRRHERREW